MKVYDAETDEFLGEIGRELWMKINTMIAYAAPRDEHDIGPLPAFYAPNVHELLFLLDWHDMTKNESPLP